MSRQHYFCRVKHHTCLLRQKLCRDKLCLPRQKFRRGKHTFIETKDKRQRTCFVATNACLSRQSFVATKTILVAANDMRERWTSQSLLSVREDCTYLCPKRRRGRRVLLREATQRGLKRKKEQQHKNKSTSILADRIKIPRSIAVRCEQLYTECTVPASSSPPHSTLESLI